jgi:hypothetical protein
LIDGISWCSGVADLKKTPLVTAAIPRKDKKHFVFSLDIS